MPSLSKVFENADGWSNWLAPDHKRYHLACCDCGLVHSMQFKVLKVRTRKGNSFNGVEVKGYRVLFRASRNKRSTTMLRKGRAKRAKRG